MSLARSTWSAQASLASQILMLVNAVVAPMTAGSGRRSPAWFARRDAAGLFWKTSLGFSQLTLVGDSPMFCETWPRWAIERDGAYGALPTWARRTSGIASSSSAIWATPVASWYERGQTSPDVWEKRQQQRRAQGKSPFATPLHVQVTQQWPTPNTGDGVRGQRQPDGKRGRALSDVAHSQGSWPTPTAADGDRTSDTFMRGNPTLIGQVHQAAWPTPRAAASRSSRASLTRQHWSAPALEQMAELSEGRLPHEFQTTNELTPQAREVYMASAWPTPTAHDYRSGTGATPRAAGHAPQLAETVKGKLNPVWVESLQGFPPNWTDIGGPLAPVKRPTPGKPRARSQRGSPTAPQG